ncbi:sulfatase family protein [Risungbinella massiliensis]|uniref:sulfatase family protein n=1 Tax=Risungbinella massiliensis TaxID=1329796 RepID=UPI00069ADD77|nr:sulfatase [Risungbinella massiliensis]
MRILFININTLRADRLGCYGNQNGLTPHLDQLASRGVVFERLFGENNVSQSSFVTMMTGKHPYQHGVVNMKPQPIPELLYPMSLFWQKNGYRTAAIDCNYRITGEKNTWFQRGYDTYIDPSEERPTHLNITAEEVNKEAIAWLEKHAHEPNFFLFLHYWDTHYPYHSIESQGITEVEPNEPSLKEFAREPLWSFIQKYGQEKTPSQLRQDYDGTVKQVDHAIGQIIQVLEQLQILDDTLIVLTSDHGESLGEHGIYFDHHGLYDASLHVPLLFHYPKILPGGIRVPTLVQHADLFPTMMELAEASPFKELGNLDGKSLLSVIKDPTRKHRKFVISCEANWQLKRSIRTTDWKLIRSLKPDVYGNPNFELYHLTTDPQEKNNVIKEHPILAKQLHQKMEGWVKKMLTRYKRQDPLRKGTKLEMNRMTVAEEEELKERLSKLGY